MEGPSVRGAEAEVAVDDPNAEGVEGMRHREGVSPFTADKGRVRVKLRPKMNSVHSGLWSCQKATDGYHLSILKNMFYTCKN